MATWKEARALEAAARLAESQRQRELAKGQREQRTTEQILGLVEGLIGAAPQAAQAFEQSQAERVLAGERPLEMPQAEDPLTGLGRFLFEPGIQRKAKQMAQERAPAEVAKLQPLTTQAVKERITAGPLPLDAPAERKELSKEEYEQRVVKAMPAEATARYVLDESPVLQLLPERERQALAAGETQRVQAEQAAAERQRKLDEAQMAKLKAQEQAALAKKGEKLDPKIVSGAVQLDVNDFVTELREPLNSTDEEIATEARQRVNQMVEDTAVALGYDPTDAQVRAGLARAVGQAYKDAKMEPLTPADVSKYTAKSDAINSLIRLDALRRKSGWNPDKEEVLKQYVVDTLNLPFNIDSVFKLSRDAFIRAGLTAEDYNYMAEAQIARQKLALEVFAGTGAVSERERASVEPFVLNPWSTAEEWDMRFRQAVQNIAAPFATDVLAQKELKQVPQDLINRAEAFNEYVDPSQYDQAVKNVLKETTSPEFGKDRPKGMNEEDQVKMLGSALADSPQILAKSLPEFTDTMLTTAKNIGVDLAEEQIEKLAPLLFGMLSSLSGGADGAQQAQEKIKVRVTFDNGDTYEKDLTEAEIQRLETAQPPPGVRKITKIEKVAQ